MTLFRSELQKIAHPSISTLRFLQQVGSPIGPLNLVAYVVRKAELSNLACHVSAFLGPIPETRSEAMNSDVVAAQTTKKLCHRHVRKAPVAFTTGEYQGGAQALDPMQYIQRFFGKWDFVFTLRLHTVSGDDRQLGIPVNFLPLRADHLPGSSSGKDQEPKCKGPNAVSDAGEKPGNLCPRHSRVVRDPVPLLSKPFLNALDWISSVEVASGASPVDHGTNALPDTTGRLGLFRLNGGQDPQDICLHDLADWLLPDQGKGIISEGIDPLGSVFVVLCLTYNLLEMNLPGCFLKRGAGN